MNACGSPAAGVAPRFTLLIGGVTAGHVEATTTSSAGYAPDAALTSGEAHDIAVQYANDAIVNAQDRDPFLQSITVNGQTSAAASSLETDAAPGIGGSTGDGNMLRSGTATFHLAAGDFPIWIPTSMPTPVAAPTSLPPATPTSLDPAFYVSTSGSAAGDGSAAHPFATLAQAKLAMESSSTHTTYVEGGIYGLASTLKLGSNDSGFSFLAAPGRTPILDGRHSLSTLVALNGASNITLSGLTFENSAGGGSPPTGALTLTRANSNSIIANHFLHSGADAILVQDSASNTVSGNEFDNSAQSAVEDKYDGNGRTDSNGNTYDSNLVNGAGSAYGAFYLHGTVNDKISHNEIENTAGIGIGVEAIGGYGGQPTYARNTGTVVTENVLNDTDQSASDSGAIYVIDRTGLDTSIQITNNMINGVTSSNTNGHIVGIYLDDYASGIRVTGNIIRGAQTHDLQFHGGRDITVRNNVLDMSGYNGASGTKAGVLFMSAPSDITPNGGPQAATNDVFTNNILLSNQRSPTPYSFLSYPTNPMISNNLYWGIAGSFDTSNDSAPQVGNPDFADAAGGNYALPSGSAASAIGFHGIDQSQMGLHPATASWYPRP